MSVKAVFFDVDGTLIDCVEKVIPESSKRAIRELQTNGYKVALATGRDAGSICGIKDIDISMFDAYVLNNGASIYDGNMRCIKKFPFLKEEVEKILHYSNKNNMSVILDTVEESFLAGKETEFLTRAKEYYDEEIPPYREWRGDEIVKINIFAPMNYDFSDLEREITARILPCPVECYDVMALGISKLSGICELMKYYGFDRNDYMAFGDQENDCEMIANAAVGVAVNDRDCFDGLQKVADYVCDAPRNNGIYNFLKNNQYIR